MRAYHSLDFWLVTTSGYKRPRVMLYQFGAKIEALSDSSITTGITCKELTRNVKVEMDARKTWTKTEVLNLR